MSSSDLIKLISIDFEKDLFKICKYYKSSISKFGHLDEEFIETRIGEQEIPFYEKFFGGLKKNFKIIFSMFHSKRGHSWHFEILRRINGRFYRIVSIDIRDPDTKKLISINKFNQLLNIQLKTMKEGNLELKNDFELIKKDLRLY